MSDDPVPLSDMPACKCNYIRHACWVHEFIYACLLSAALSSKVSGRLQIHQTCLQVGCRSHRYHPGRNLEYSKFWISLRCYNDNVCSSKISKIKFCMQILGAHQSQGRFSYIFFCYKLPSCGYLGGHLGRILFLLFICLQAKCLQLDFNFIAYNLRKKMGLSHIFCITLYFHL